MTRCPICGRTDPHGHAPRPALPTAPDVVAEAWPPANVEWAPGVSSWRVGAEWMIGHALARLGFALAALCAPRVNAPLEGARDMRDAARFHRDAYAAADLAAGLAQRVREGWPPRR